MADNDLAALVPPPCEDLLSERYRNAWCGDTDVTGRYVCRRVRNHALDFHAARNSAGGIHQWPVRTDERAGNMPADIPATSEPADDPIGAVRVHPDDDPKRWDARRVMFVSTRTERPWWGIAGDPFGLPAMSHDEVRGWKPQSLADLAVALGHAEPSVDAALRERLRATNESLLAMLERMETLHVTFIGPGGEEIHPDWCRECRVDKVRAELADMRASREAWAIEAVGLDGLAEKGFGYYSQLYDAVSKAAKLPPSQNVDVLVAAVGRLASERDEAQAELAERPTVWAYEQATQALEKRRTALVTALGGDRSGQGFYDAVVDVERLVEALASRPAIPADAEEQFRMALAYPRMPSTVEDAAKTLVAIVRSWSAPVSGSDTAPTKSH